MHIGVKKLVPVSWAEPEIMTGDNKHNQAKHKGMAEGGRGPSHGYIKL